MISCHLKLMLLSASLFGSGVIECMEDEAVGQGECISFEVCQNELELELSKLMNKPLELYQALIQNPQKVSKKGYQSASLLRKFKELQALEAQLHADPKDVIGEIAQKTQKVKAKKMTAS